MTPKLYNHAPVIIVFNIIIILSTASYYCLSLNGGLHYVTACITCTRLRYCIFYSHSHIFKNLYLSIIFISLVFLEEKSGEKFDMVQNDPDVLIGNPTGAVHVRRRRKSPPSDIPLPCGIPRARSIFHTSIELEWEASPSSSEYVQYEVKQVLGRGRVWKKSETGKIRVVEGNVTTTVKNLEPDTLYYFQVKPVIKKIRGHCSTTEDPIRTAKPTG